MKLVVLGRYDLQMPYHKQVMDAAGVEVMFPGAIYDKATVSALRFHSALYAHDHQVGGTNPSLVEAMGAGSAVLAHAPSLALPRKGGCWGSMRGCWSQVQGSRGKVQVKTRCARD